MDYYQFRDNNIIQKVQAELDFFMTCNYANTPMIREYVTYAHSRIDTEKLPGMKKIDLESYTKDVEKMVYAQPWSKLKEFHKKVKITEYIDELPFGTAKGKKRAIQMLVDGLHEKRYGKHKATIDYDPELMKIIAISCIVQVKNEIKVEWD